MSVAQFESDIRLTDVECAFLFIFYVFVNIALLKISYIFLLF